MDVGRGLDISIRHRGSGGGIAEERGLITGSLRMLWTASAPAHRCLDVGHDSEARSMLKITAIGFDIAKSTFQANGVDAGGQVVDRRQLKRRSVLGFFQKPSCLVGISLRLVTPETSKLKKRRRTEALSIRLSVQERDAVNTAAEAAGVGLSARSRGCWS